MLKGAVRSRSQLPLVLLVYFVTPTVDVEPFFCRQSADLWFNYDGILDIDETYSNRLRNKPGKAYNEKKQQGGLRF